MTPTGYRSSVSPRMSDYQVFLVSRPATPCRARAPWVRDCPGSSQHVELVARAYRRRLDRPCVSNARTRRPVDEAMCVRRELSSHVCALENKNRRTIPSICNHTRSHHHNTARVSQFASSFASKRSKRVPLLLRLMCVKAGFVVTFIRKISTHKMLSFFPLDLYRGVCGTRAMRRRLRVSLSRTARCQRCCAYQRRVVRVAGGASRFLPL